MTPSADTIVSEVLGRVPSGCAIMTAGHEGRSSGMLTSWIQQASLEPLLVSVAVREGRPLQALLDGSGRFVLNLLGGDPKPLFRHFAKGFGPGESAFEGLLCRPSEYGVVLEDALGYLGCSVVSRTPAGDHWLYLGRPESAGFASGGEPYVHIRKSATNY